MVSSTPNRDAVHTYFAELITAYQAGDLTPVADVFSTSAQANTSLHGDFSGREAIIDGLSGVSPQGGSAKYFLTNEYIAVEGAQAQQSAYLSVAVFDDGAVTPAVSWFGAHFVNSWRRSGDQWQLVTLRFEHDWMQGVHPTFRSWPDARNELGWEPGTALPKTISALDAPWRVIPDNVEPGSDEQQIVDTFTRYTWGVDQGDLALAGESLTENISTDIVPFGKLGGRREFLSTLQLFRSGRVYLHHVMGATRVQIDGDTARLTVFRLVPYGAAPELLERNVYGATYECTAVKEASGWKLDSITYTEGQLFELT